MRDSASSIDHIWQVVPRLPLLSGPTKVCELERIGAELGRGKLLIKRDDLAGGCKMRSLEYLLGTAINGEVDVVLTSGREGSNYLATAGLITRRLGVKLRALVRARPPTPDSIRNDAIATAAGVEFIRVSDTESLRSGGAAMRHSLDELQRRGQRVLLLPFGGASTVASFAHARAALELREQLDLAEVGEPNRIYVAAASMTTASGLLVGLRLAGLGTHVVAVSITPEEPAGATCMRGRVRDLIEYITSHDAELQPHIMDDDIDVRDGSGPGFGHPDAEAQAVATRVSEQEKVALESTYTAKAFARMLADARREMAQSDRWLFWHTGTDLEDSRGQVR